MDNIYVLIADVRKRLRRAGCDDLGKEMSKRIDAEAQSYDDAVAIIAEYEAVIE